MRSDRALYFTDLHLWDRDISTRIDRSSEAVLAKLDFLVESANLADCGLMISGGDLFQDKIDSDEYRARIITILRKYKGKFYSLIGNHDILWRSFETYYKRGMGVLEAAGLAEVLDTQLLASHGVLGISAFAEVAVPEGQAEQVRIVFAHHFINHGFDRLVLEIPVLKQTFPNTSYVFTGHDHSEYPTVTQDGVRIIRPGGAMRVSSALENVRRAPKALVLDFVDGGVKTQDLLIPCIQAKDAFNLEAKVIAKEAEQQLDSFLGELAASKAVGLDLSAALNAKLQAVTDPDLREYLVADIPTIGQ